MNDIAAYSPDADAIPIMASKGISGDELTVALLEQSADCIKILSLDGHLEFMNCNGQRAMEVDQFHLFIGKLWWGIWPVSSRDFVKSRFEEAVQGTEVNFAAWCPTAKGAPRRWSVNLRPLFALAGPVVSILATSRNITSEQMQ